MTARRAAVLGSPIAHSRSPQLHLAAYRELGLTDWTYDRIECTEAQLPGLVGGFGPEWVGVSVTMPGKFAALRFATERTERAELVGSANTLVRVDGGWRADNTDVDGVVGALGAVSGPAAVLGSGGTAPAAVVALASLGISDISVVARNADKAASLVELGTSSACAPGGSTWVNHSIPLVWWSIRCPPTWPRSSLPPWPTLLCCSTPSMTHGRRRWRRPCLRAGGRVVSGSQMLLHQAFAQVEQFTGMPAPREAMAAALAAS